MMPLALALPALALAACQQQPANEAAADNAAMMGGNDMMMAGNNASAMAPAAPAAAPTDAAGYIAQAGAGDLFEIESSKVALEKSQTKAVREDAERDALTGLKMRGPFEAQAIAMLNRARDKDVPVSVIVADIDHFKRVNDIWGHQVGDTAIASFGDLLRSTIRDTDIAGRIGGEEFCILVWNCPEEPTLNLAERIRARFEQLPIEGISDDVRLTASFGVAQWVTDEGYGRLFARADAALYRAKEGGRNSTSADGDDRPRAVVSPLQQGPDPREVRA